MTFCRYYVFYQKIVYKLQMQLFLQNSLGICEKRTMYWLVIILALEPFPHCTIEHWLINQFVWVLVMSFVMFEEFEGAHLFEAVEFFFREAEFPLALVTNAHSLISRCFAIFFFVLFLSRFCFLLLLLFFFSFLYMRS